MFFFLQFLNIEVQESHVKNTDFFFIIVTDITLASTYPETDQDNALSNLI